MPGEEKERHEDDDTEPHQRVCDMLRFKLAEDRVI